MAREQDAVDRIVAQWARARPDVDVSPIEVIGRISRLSRRIDQLLAESFARFGIEAWMYDVLATLRRASPDGQLTAGELVRETMVTTGAMTKRIDRLAERGLVERVAAQDRRVVLVRLTAAGRALVDEVIVHHVAFEQQLLASLSDRQRRDLAGRLRTLLLALEGGEER